jgi:nephrocystin-3
MTIRAILSSCVVILSTHLAMPHPKNEFRVFVSSTFTDLQPEREQLVKKTFPRIRAACRERGVEFVEIDLRWGITEEESRSGRTIRICLEEIDRCRPYFIGILGSRYGWVPGATEIEKDPEMLAAFPWLREYAASEKSIIEMEFAHGALLEKNDSAFFYEQLDNNSPLPLDLAERKLRPQEQDPGRGRAGGPLENLKDTLRTTGLPYRRFTSPEELGEQVYRDLLAILDRDWPLAKELTPAEHARLDHDAFSRNRRKSYVANSEYYDAFAKHVESDGPPLVVWGQSGLGKSALMAYLAHEYERRNPGAFVIQHYIGAAEDTNAEDIMRHILLEIKERYDLTDAIPPDSALREEFPSWLAKVKDERLKMKDENGSDDSSFISHLSSFPLVLFIDALNQLTGLAHELHWLPDFIPPNVRLVVSTTPGEPLEELRRRVWQELELRPLTGEQVETIAQNFLAEYRKVLQPEQRAMIAAEEKTRRPLFLRTVLEEVRVFGSHSKLSAHLAGFLASEDERDLFQLVLARMERDHGEEAVRTVMTAIWAARHGLSETELLEVTNLPRLKLSELLIAMEYHLMQREGLYTFFHNYLREGVEQRYLSSSFFSPPLGEGPGEGLVGTSSEWSNEINTRETVHELLAQYFSTREYAARRREEEPWQWRAADNIDQLWRCLADSDMFMLFANEEQRYNFIAYLQSFERERTQELFRALHEAVRADGTFDRALELAQTARIAGYYDAATGILAAISERADAMELDYKTSLRIKREQSQLYSEKHEYKLALPLCEEIVALIESKEGKSEELFNAMIDLSTVMHGVRDYAGAEIVIRRALEFGNLASDTMRLNAMQNLASFILAQGDSENAIASFKEGFMLSSKLLGRSHPSTLLFSMNLAAALIIAGHCAGALEILEEALPVIKQTLGDRHVWYIACLEHMGKVLTDAGEYSNANGALLELVDKSVSVYGFMSEQALRAQLSLGYLYYQTREFFKAKEIYEKYLPALELCVGSKHQIISRASDTLDKIYAALSDNNLAL